MTDWQPWHELARKPHVILGRALLPSDTGGAVHVQRRGRSVIVLDPRLTQVERNYALTHELVHDERGGGCDHPDAPASWRDVVVREERRVDDEAVRRLVPPDQLLAFCVRVSDVQGCLGPAEVADEFNVPWAVAERALILLDEGGRQATERQEALT